MAAGPVLKQFSLDLDLKAVTPSRPFEVVDGDTGNVIVLNIKDGGTALDLTGRQVKAVFASSKGVNVQDELSGVSKSGGTVTIELAPESFAPGMVECEIEIWSASIGLTIGHSYDMLATTARFNFTCRSAIRERQRI